eukprot:TRINITY_DN20829_c0_g2_i1.p1 TRINITY_DN20829_c0_g2~~TRINITY_DN20829_c0_g2_i1.p1  ORF type:complete len:390 (+),score=29.78 TRINITY_DN20829_c0_g2_i1:42-1172(+)
MARPSLVMASLGLVVHSSNICHDAPGWHNGWSGCAWESGGKNVSWCMPTPGAQWPSTMGWTCEYYRAKGWCGEDAMRGVINQSIKHQFGAIKSWPERYCCGCAPKPDTSCNRNTGHGCKMSPCGYEQGPSTCVKSTTCMCTAGHCADTDGLCSLQVSEPSSSVNQTDTAAALETCKDTPGWHNAWSGCAWQPGGKNASWCMPSPGAEWPATIGWTCEYYRQKGLCVDGELRDPGWTSGSMHNYPERNCCGCQKPKIPKCNRMTGGTCSMLGCDASRGPTVCVNRTWCMCKPGHCATDEGYCSLYAEEDHDPFVPVKLEFYQISDAESNLGISDSKWWLPGLLVGAAALTTATLLLAWARGYWRSPRYIDLEGAADQ